jgi:hypothetical protein
MADGIVLTPQSAHSSRSALSAGLIGAVAIAEVELVYRALQPRLPTTVPLFFSNGVFSDPGPPTTHVTDTVLEIAVATAIFVLLAAATPSLEEAVRAVRGHKLNLLFVAFPVLVLVALAGSASATLALAAAALPPSVAAPWFVEGMTSVPIVAALLLAGFLYVFCPEG